MNNLDPSLIQRLSTESSLKMSKPFADMFTRASPSSELASDLYRLFHCQVVAYLVPFYTSYPSLDPHVIHQLLMDHIPQHEKQMSMHVFKQWDVLWAQCKSTPLRTHFILENDRHFNDKMLEKIEKSPDAYKRMPVPQRVYFILHHANIQNEMSKIFDPMFQSLSRHLQSLSQTFDVALQPSLVDAKPSSPSY